MISDLPELDDFFSSKTNKVKKKTPQKPASNTDINIYISKDSETWISAEFIDIAVGRIGLHVALPETIELTAEELYRLKIKFTKMSGSKESLLKESQVQVRWQENDSITGKLKLGLHFHSEVKDDIIMQDIFKSLKG